MILFLIRVWLCRGGAKGEKAWERSGGLGEVPEGPQHQSTEGYNVQMLGNQVCRLLQDVCRGSYRKLKNSTGNLLTSAGCSTVGVLGDGEVMEWYGWIGKMEMEMEPVMAQGQRNKMEKECTKLVDGQKDGSNERSRKWSYVGNGRVGR